MLFAETESRLLPASCLTSSVFGGQQLSSGKDAFCDNGWTVIVLVNLFDSVPKFTIKE